MSPSQPLRARIAALLEDPDDRTLARSILGTDDVETIAARVEAYCRDALGRSVAGSFGFVQSIGAVFLLDLDDGARLALKAHGAEEERIGVRTTRETLRATTSVQDGMAREGVPCARVLRGPDAWPGGHVIAMEVIDAGEHRDPHAPPVRRAMAGFLAEIVRRGERWRDTPHLPRCEPPAGAVWPKPHNALFDFGVAGGEWIDELAREARAILAELPERIVVAHTDFSGANMRFAGAAEAPHVSALYDGDSFALIDEMRLVAGAAVHFAYLPSPVDGTWLWPTRDEARAFVAEYVEARGAPLSAVERRRLDACATYALGYTAKCEHGTDPKGERLEGSMRAALRSEPRRYLSG